MFELLEVEVPINFLCTWGFSARGDSRYWVCKCFLSYYPRTLAIQPYEPGTRLQRESSTKSLPLIQAPVYCIEHANGEPLEKSKHTCCDARWDQCIALCRLLKLWSWELYLQVYGAYNNIACAPQQYSAQRASLCPLPRQCRQNE